MDYETLLAADAVINLALGLLLVLYPAGLIRLLGVPDIRPSFYARILGGVLFGIGLALVIEASPPHGQGLGLTGAIAINLCGAAVLAGVLLTQRLGIPPRGQVLLWGLCLILLALSGIELAWYRGWL